MRRSTYLLIALVVVGAAACGDGATTTTASPTTTAAATTQPEPTVSPAAVVFTDQRSDGSSIVVDSVTLPAPGFIAVHGNADGTPGPVIGHSVLLPAGTSTDVEVTLTAPLGESGPVFPMAHIDMNGNGEYEFFPPDETIDGPARTADGDVAVVGAEVTVGGDGGEAAGHVIITIENFDFGVPVTAAPGQTITVRNSDGAPHTWTAADGSFASGTLEQGDEFSITLDEPGTYSFFCEIHPSMTGTLTVSG